MLDFTNYNQHLASIDDGGAVRSLKDIANAISQVRTLLSHTPAEYSSDYAKVRMVSYNNGAAVDDTPTSNQSIPKSLIAERLSQLTSLRTKVLNEAGLLSQPIGVDVTGSITTLAPVATYIANSGQITLADTKIGSLLVGASVNPVMTHWATSTGGSWKGIGAWVGTKPTQHSGTEPFIDESSPFLILLSETRDYTQRIGVIAISDSIAVSPHSWRGYVFRTESGMADLLEATLHITALVVGSRISYDVHLDDVTLTAERDFTVLADAPVMTDSQWFDCNSFFAAMPADVTNLLTISANEQLTPRPQVWCKGFSIGPRFPASRYNVDMVGYIQYLLDICNVDQLITDLQALLA